VADRRLLSGLIVCAAAILVAGPVAVRMTLRAEDEATAADATLPIQIFADWSQEWSDEGGYVGLFRGHCRIVQGDAQYAADKMVVWVQRESGTTSTEDVLTIYLEDHALTRTEDGDTSTNALVVSLKTTQGMTLTVRGRQTNTSGAADALYQRAQRRRQGARRQELEPTQLTIDPLVGQYRTVPLPGVSGTVRRVRIFQRGAVPFSIESFQSPDTSPPEQVVLLRGGINLLVDGAKKLGTVDLSADRAVIWTTAVGSGEFSTDMLQTEDSPYQVYLEGNIVIRQGTTEVRADRAFYDAREDQALVINAELKAYLPDLDSSVRVRSERLRQLSQVSFHAQNAWITTSQYGRPGYRLDASDVFLEQRPTSPWSQPRIDPNTGQPLPVYWATVFNSTLVVEDVPLLYAPRLSVPGEDPGIPLQTLTFRQDRIFGTQVRSRWDGFKLFGVERQNDDQWNVEFDLLSERGPLIGTDGHYRGMDAAGNTYFGNGVTSYVHDDGNDNLGLGRRSLIPNDNDRGWAIWRHRHLFNVDLMLQGEVGYESDRNFREQYYESTFDRGKDSETLAYLRQSQENWAWSVLARPQVNMFENTTQWLPRGDLTLLGEPLAGGWLNWSTHTMAGYASLRQSQPPSDPNDLFTPIPYFPDADGLVAMTRHEVTAPFNLGPVKVSPYALGEAAFWGDGFTSESVDRLYFRGGVRASVLFWRVYPYVQSDVFNLNGLAHKMVFNLDYGWADASRSLTEIPQWNEFNDDAQERFEQRYVDNTFGGVVPPEFDPRFYAVRYGAGTWVTDPYHELVDDQQALRLGWNQRLQTKTGPPERQRIKDWMTLDLGVTVFPDADRDNFGETFGLLYSRYAWRVGDRTSILASSLNDFFEDAQNVWSVGVLSQRSQRGSIYLGLRNIEGGPLDSQILTASYIYRMSDKWMSRMSTAFDVGEGQNRGQSMTITRVGEWLLLHVGANFDASKNNVGVAIAVEPRLGNTGMSTGSLNSLLNGPPR
jgi:lipopolysaccharide export system protein LptA